MSQTMIDRIARMRSSIAEHTATIDTALAAADTEDRQLTDTELATLEQTRAQVEAMTGELEHLVAFHNSVAGADALAPVHVPRAHTKPRSDGDPVSPAIETVGQRFVASDELRGYRGGRSATVELDDVLPSAFALGHTRATLTEATSPWDDYLAAGGAVGGVVAAPVADKPRPLLEVISRAPTTLASVPVLRIGADEAGAAVVAEGDLKPEVTWTETFDQVPVDVIAGHKKSSRQILDDVALMRNLIDTKLTRSVLNATEAKILTAVTGAIGAGNTTTVAAAADALLTGTRLAIGELENRSKFPNAVMFNPLDYAAMDLAVLAKTLLGPVIGSQFWSLRVVSNPNVAEGTAIVGDFAEAVTLFERAGMSMFVTDSDISGEGAQTTSDFRRNIMTFLAEIRAVPVVLDASAIEAVVINTES